MGGGGSSLQATLGLDFRLQGVLGSNVTNPMRKDLNERPPETLKL